jgi:hypothetical protein
MNSCDYLVPISFSVDLSAHHCYHHLTFHLHPTGLFHHNPEVLHFQTLNVRIKAHQPVKDDMHDTYSNTFTIHLNS